MLFVTHFGRVPYENLMPFGTCLLLVAGQVVWAAFLITFPVWPKDGIVVLAVGRHTPSPPSHRFGRSRHSSTHRPTPGQIEVWRISDADGPKNRNR